jgi:sensor histidine kinase YesM
MGTLAQGRLNGYGLEEKALLDGSLHAVIFTPEAKMSGVVSFIALLALAAAALLLLLLLLAYRISSKIAKPIEAICEQVRELDLESGMLEKVETDIAEIHILAETIGELKERLKISAERIASLEAFELQSQLFALQAQTQPHFLHNTLMVMEAAAEAGGRLEVINMCRRLAGMLRYISLKSVEGVMLAEELSHLENYMEIMRARFPDIELDVDVPFKMLSIMIPKLLIQPLVENSLKHGDKLDMAVSVKGWMEGGKWRIRVCDDGKGFDPLRLAGIKASLEAGPRAEGPGLGLRNIYYRLLLRDKDRTFFELSNNPGGGACVELGGFDERAASDGR